MVPSGNANAAATLSRNGVSGLIRSRDGIVPRILRPLKNLVTPFRNCDSADVQLDDNQRRRTQWWLMDLSKKSLP
jgi:hypothetical protein